MHWLLFIMLAFKSTQSAKFSQKHIINGLNPPFARGILILPTCLFYVNNSNTINKEEG